MLTERQQRILGLVVGGYLDSGKPIGSAAIAEDPDVEWRASTVRNELAVLEREGYLTHPHTSAGRVPTDSGYRFYADTLLSTGAKRAPAQRQLDLTQVRREIEEALRETASTLSRMTDLLAVATAPPPSAARVHRVEVLRAAARGRDGRRHRLQRSRHQADVQLRPAGRSRAARVGVELPQRAAQRARARRADDRRPARRSRARSRRARVRRRDPRRLHGARAARLPTTSTSRAPRGCSRPSTRPTCRAPTR